eukprot:TRINITY_DN2468_c0_g2_i2.p1 TRINITY_DN2468_c0_g2~~TRINITY_DN2468_c0_g2_i2.p1  ORF type:complete len:195 (+),score=42.57 TRINITY_DN2468_c0_g2_i2:87-587(+)
MEEHARSSLSQHKTTAKIGIVGMTLLLGCAMVAEKKDARHAKAARERAVSVSSETWMAKAAVGSDADAPPVSGRCCYKTAGGAACAAANKACIPSGSKSGCAGSEAECEGHCGGVWCEGAGYAYSERAAAPPRASPSWVMLTAAAGWWCAAFSQLCVFASRSRASL